MMYWTRNVTSQRSRNKQSALYTGKVLSLTTGRNQLFQQNCRCRQPHKEIQHSSSATFTYYTNSEQRTGVAKLLRRTERSLQFKVAVARDFILQIRR